VKPEDLTQEDIEELKRNRTPYGLMGNKGRLMLQAVGIENCEYFLAFEDGKEVWLGCIKLSEFEHHLTYRLLADYELEPEIEECEVYEGFYAGEPSLLYRRKRRAKAPLQWAVSDPDFIRAETADGDVYTSIFRPLSSYNNPADYVRKIYFRRRKF
jgi:hypothetical protein